MPDGDEKKKPEILVDTDWKSQAQAEKERLAEAEAKAESEGGGPRQPGKLPPADFKTLVGTIATPAVMSLGMMQDPQTGQIVLDLEGARFYIDLLGVLEEKTKGNLAEDEAAELTAINNDLRARFVEVARAVAANMAQQEASGANPAPPGGAPPAGPSIEI